MKKINGLNIVKIMACIIVVCHHYQQFLNCYFEGKVNFFNGNFYFGFIVELFFMCSGILAYHGLKEKNFNLPSFVNYMKAKFIRFFPMCFLSLLFLFMMQWILYFVTGSAILWEVPTVSDFILSIFFLDKGVGLDKFVPATHITWYISILLMLYALFYVIVWLRNEKKINIGCVSFLLVITGIVIWIHEDDLLFKNYPFLNSDFARGLVGFFSGILVYILLDSIPKVSKIYAYIGLPLIVLSMIYDYKKTGSVSSPLIGSAYLGCVLVLYPSIMIICMSSKIIKKISEIKVMDYIEKLSFPVYLWHINILLIINRLIEKGHISINHSYKTMLAFVIIVFVLAIPFYEFVEKPITKKVRELVNK